MFQADIFGMTSFLSLEKKNPVIACDVYTVQI